MDPRITCTRTAVTSLLLALTLATSAQAQSIELVSLLNGGDVVPNKALTGALALAELTVDTTKREITFEIDVYNLPTGVNGAHIHVGSSGVMGPVLFDLRPVPRQAGDFTLRGTLSGADLTAHPDLGIRDIIDALESVIGFATYIDIHTDAKPGGEIRGALVPFMDDSVVATARRSLQRSATLGAR